MNYYSKIFQLLSEEHWTGKQKKEREKSEHEQQWRTWPLDPKDPSKGTLQVQKVQHQETKNLPPLPANATQTQKRNLLMAMPTPGVGRKIKRVRVTKPIPSWMGMKGKMVHHTTARPDSVDRFSRPFSRHKSPLDAPKSVEKHTTVTAKLPGGKQVRNKRFPTTHDN